MLRRTGTPQWIQNEGSNCFEFKNLWGYVIESFSKILIPQTEAPKKFNQNQKFATRGTSVVSSSDSRACDKERVFVY